MADVFISWSSVDKAVAEPLRDALKNAGYSVDEYSVDLTGGNISENVRRYVEEARLVIFVFSATSVDKPWIQTEVEWVYFRRAGGKDPEVIPLLVGNVAETSLPHVIQTDPLLRKFKLPAESLTTNDEFKLKETVRLTLGFPSPIVVPAALLAMNREQAEALLETASVKASILSLCGTVGMKPFPDLKDFLLHRYGLRAEDFSPFPEKTLKQIVEETIKEMNEARRSGIDPSPLWIWWCNEELVNTTHRDHVFAEQLWERGPSIAVVDSISVLDESVYDKFIKLPEPLEAASSALLWVPPYTLHTAQLETVTESTFTELNRLLQKIRTWRSKSGGSYLAFDIGTRPTLRRWIYQAFVNVTSQATPRADNVAAMRQVQQSQFKRGPFFTTQQPPQV